VAPVSNKILDENNKSKFLRNIFPRNFIFGLIIASLAFIFSFILKNHWSIVISFIISLGFIINLLIIMPKINFISDSDSLEKEKKKKQFRNWHFSSVFIYLIQIIISIVGIYLNI
jgi:magnesium-transporting ATPase (P-type)|tara:strand:+ start:954 stop:1298 length:345 start_codon:yes stop_codon:yes gene_type:complete